ncbi:outer membrane cobalamin receptor [Anseongella ginsenosidimutans]|uniref:Outer membrane cobalamin receptor n=2 Tax=Anseongella ginsenosidimutans TaxID=496056 RepID=A0A4R3KU67_9SPHI|nr:outer membrane cobalamin receptor [Anseongella ginsenosidimutans]
MVLSSQVLGQISISGTVKERNGKPLAGASVYLTGTLTGATSDEEGRFRFEVTEKGIQTLAASFLGFLPFEKEVTLDGKDITLDIVLQPDPSTMDPVVVSAGSFEASDKAKGASLTPIDAMTVAGTGGDIANGLRALPGAQQIGEAAGLFVRGGTGAETRQFVDGTLLRNPNYSEVPGLMQPARLPPFLFKGILFSSGGYSALYGQAMSSALILESVDLPETSSASFSAFAPGHLSGGFQKLAPGKKSSYGISGHYSNLSPYNEIVPQKPDFFMGPEYLGVDLNYRVKTSETGMFKVYGNWGSSNIGMNNTDIDSLPLVSRFGLMNRNAYLNLDYREYLGENWKIDAAAAFSYNKDDIATKLLDSNSEMLELPREPFRSKNSHRIARSRFGQGRMVVTRQLPRNQAVRFGAEQFYFRDRFNYNDSLTTLTDHFTAAFAEGDVYITDRIAAKLGLRFEYSSLLKKAAVAPRLGLAYRIKDGQQVNLAYGLFFQKPENEFLIRNRALNYANAAHYIINYTRKEGNRFLRLEAYYKQYRNLVTTGPAAGNDGKGYARGAELFWRDKKTFPNLDYWLTYTYLDTKREFRNYPSSLRPSFSAPHTATLAIKKFFPGISTNVNVSYSFASGRPYYDIRKQDNGTFRVFDQGTTKPYNVVNLHIAYLTSFFKNWKQPDFSGIALGANNILGTPQVFGYNYSYNGVHKTPVTLPAPRSFFIGVFMSFGVDRTDDFMNENL